jgi:hypothetical protein
VKRRPASPPPPPVVLVPVPDADERLVKALAMLAALGRQSS